MKLEKFDLGIIKFAIECEIRSFKNLVKETGSENGKSAIKTYEEVLAKVDAAIKEVKDGEG